MQDGERLPWCWPTKPAIFWISRITIFCMCFLVLVEFFREGSLDGFINCHLRKPRPVSLLLFRPARSFSLCFYFPCHASPPRCQLNSGTPTIFYSIFLVPWINIIISSENIDSHGVSSKYMYWLRAVAASAMATRNSSSRRWAFEVWVCSHV